MNFEAYKKVYLILETGEAFSGLLVNTGYDLSHKKGSLDTAGEVVFNTSHTGYEEIATDPSYFSQIVIMTAPMQGNYGALEEVRESERFWIRAFICLELDDSYSYPQSLLKKRSKKGKNHLKELSQRLHPRNEQKNHSQIKEKPIAQSWMDRMVKCKIPALTALDTRAVVLRLREKGVSFGAVIEEENLKKARDKARVLIQNFKEQDLDWAYKVSTKNLKIFKGHQKKGPKIAVLDFGCKKNILRELKKYTSEIALFPCRSSAQEIKNYRPHGILLSNGPGDPKDVKVALETVKALLNWRFIFGICMGHQILGMALGGKTYKLPFGHRGSNHPVKNTLNHQVYVTSQNHGYALHKEGLLPSVKISHLNMNDQSVAGIDSKEKKCMGVQFHPESAPGTHDAKSLFQEFINRVSQEFDILQ